MAVVRLLLDPGRSSGSILAKWVTAITTGNTGEPLGLSTRSDKTVTITGTATSFALQGSNNGTDWFTLHDIDMSTAITSTGIFTIKENPVFIRPNTTTGSVTVEIACV